MKICPRCGSEFQDRLERCLDCSTPLKSDQEMPTLDASVTDVCLESGDIESLLPLSAALRARGIPTRLVEESGGWGVKLCGVPVWDSRKHRLFVAAEDAREGEEIARVVLGPRDAELQAIDFGEGRCPACGAELEPEADKCPDCLLVLDSPPAPFDLSTTPVDAIGLPDTVQRRRR